MDGVVAGSLVAAGACCVAAMAALVFLPARAVTPVDDETGSADLTEPPTAHGARRHLGTV